MELLRTVKSSCLGQEDCACTQHAAVWTAGSQQDDLWKPPGTIFQNKEEGGKRSGVGTAGAKAKAHSLLRGHRGGGQGVKVLRRKPRADTRHRAGCTLQSRDATKDQAGEETGVL